MLIRIAWRSIWRSRRRTLITVCSIGLGLTFAIFFISLGEGMYDRMIDQAVRMQAGYITLENPKYRAAPAVDLLIDISPALRRQLAAIPGVEDTKMLILGQGIAKSGSGNVAAAIMGVEPSVEAKTSPLARNMIKGSYLADSDQALVVLGNEMADRLNLDVGKKLVLSSNDINGNLVEVLCRVKGIFRTGSVDMDTYFIQAPLSFTRQLFHLPPGGTTQLGLILSAPDRQAQILKQVKTMVPQTVAVLPWQLVMPDVASYIKLDRGSNIIFQAILLFLILFTIFNTILMSVLERQREFAVLLALGTAPGQIRLQILLESAFLGLVGCLVGLTLGGISVYLGQVYGIDLSSVMGEGINISGFALSSKMHTKMSADIMFGAAGIVFLTTLIISLVPMRRISRVSIVDEMR